MPMLFHYFNLVTSKIFYFANVTSEDHFFLDYGYLSALIYL